MLLFLLEEAMSVDPDKDMTDIDVPSWENEMSMNSQIVIHASQKEIATPIFATGLVESVTPR
jgi:hypothetical protein